MKFFYFHTIFSSLKVCIYNNTNGLVSACRAVLWQAAIREHGPWTSASRAVHDTSTMASPRPRGKEKGRRRPKTPYVARCAKPKPGGIESSAAAGSADKLGRSFSVNGKGVRVAMVLHRLWQFGFSSRRGRTECWIAS